METGVNLVYDCSFNVFLSTVYQAYESKIFVTDIVKKELYQKDIFSSTIQIETDLNHAKRVWYKLRDTHYEALKNVYFAFLSELPGIEIRLYREIVRRMGGLKISDKNHSPGELHYIEDIVNKVAQEKRKWESSIDLNFYQDKPAIVRIKPSYDILPLISRFFRLTYTSNPWIIFDQERDYGIYFDGISTQLITDIPHQFNWADAA